VCACACVCASPLCACACARACGCAHESEWMNQCASACEHVCASECVRAFVLACECYWLLHDCDFVHCTSVRSDILTRLYIITNGERNQRTQLATVKDSSCTHAQNPSLLPLHEIPAFNARGSMVVASSAAIRIANIPNTIRYAVAESTSASTCGCICVVCGGGGSGDGW
jgi:hypothetical protein